MDTRLVNPHDCQYVQSRVALDILAVAEYEDMMERGIVFEPCKGILCDDGAIIIYDGNHRAEAAKGNGAMIEVELTPGTAQDADWQASGANTRHGIRRTASDIEKSVKAALRHPNAQGLSDREIARHCGCDHKTVGKYRKELEASGDIPQMPVKTVTRNGAEYQMTIPIPKDPEPASTRTPSPMVYDEHMHTTPKKPQAKASDADIQMVIKDWLFVEHDFDVDSAQEELTEAIYEPIYKAERFNRLAQYVELRLVCTRSDIRQACKLLIEHTEALQPGNAHQPEPEPTPRCHRVRCLDCGEGLPLPADRDALHLCLECQDARRREQERLIEVHRRQGLIPPPEPEKHDQESLCAECGTKILPGYAEEYQGKFYHANCHLRVTRPQKDDDDDDIEICDFCGEEFPEDDLYQDTDPKTIPNFYICRACAQKALASIVSDMPDDDGCHAWQTDDRLKIVNAGLSLYRAHKVPRPEIRQFVPNDAGNFGSWRICEKFESIAALKRRYDEMKTEPLSIFERHL